MDLERSLAYAALATHPHDAARVLEGLPPEAATELLARAEPAVAAGVLRSGAPQFSADVLALIPRDRARHILEHVPAEVTAGLLRRLPDEARQGLLEELPRVRVRAVRSLLTFPPRCAGSWMDPEALALPEDVSVEEAIRRLREDSERVLPYVYVLDRDDVLKGVASLREILAAPGKDLLGSRMHADVQSVPASASARTVLEHPGWKTLSSLPVVDDRGVFLGAIRYSTYRGLEQEARRAETEPGAATARAIGDLFSTAVGGVIEAVATTFSPEKPR